MRKVIYVIALFLLMCSFSSCDKSSKETALQFKDDYFEYPQNIIGNFDVDDQGYLYYLAAEEADDIKQENNSESMTFAASEGVICSINSNGELIDRFPLESTIGDIVISVADDSIYYTSIIPSDYEETMKEAMGLYEYNKDSKKNREIYQFTDFQSIDKLENADDKIYFIGINNDLVHKEYALADIEDTYQYSGEAMGIIDVKDGSMEDIPVEYPIAFSKTTDNNLLIYAYDAEGGYYFTEFNTKKNSLSKKTYHDLGQIYNFDIYNRKNDFIFANEDNIDSLSASKIEAGSGITEVMPDVYIFRGANIKCVGGYTFYRNSKTNIIERIKNSAYIRSENTIRMLNSQFFLNDPFGCGYSIERQKIDEESFALSVLSQDDNFDLSIMDSRQDISANIRDKGTFYPLNEVEGVKEYMDALFPYIRDAATTEDGDIWMLPISVDIPVILYNENFCSKQGIDISSSMNLKEFSDLLLGLSENEDLMDKFDSSPYILRENAFYQYFYDFDNFDTEVFRELALLFKEDLNYLSDTSKIKPNGEVASQLSLGNGENILFTLDYYYDTQAMSGSRNENFRAAELPYIKDYKPNVATCMYLCVNPTSKNLKETLSYISSLSKYLIQQDKAMIFADRDRYSDTAFYDDLYRIYENAVVQFTLPVDIFLADFHAYLKDEIDLETLVGEAERKVDVYLKE